MLLTGFNIPEYSSGFECLNSLLQKAFLTKKLPGSKEVMPNFQLMNRTIVKPKMLLHFSSLPEKIQTTQIIPLFVMLSFHMS